MIWARPLSNDSATSLWNRSGLTPEGVGLVRSSAEAHALVTGLSDDARELLAELVGPAWVGGAGDSAIVRWSRLSVEAWTARLGPGELSRAFQRLLPAEAPSTRIAEQTWSWGERTRIMGIVNATPDSFSDGGAHTDPVAHALSLLDAGADLVDVGGESTRPGAADVNEAEELRRVLPVIEGVRKARPGAVISIDTRKAAVAKAAISAGAHLVNDVSGLRDDAMLEVIADARVPACVMHMLGTPETMQREPR
ncbi:MAG TPA: dihydropteroate synthase, partial [Archangium sp.]